MKKTVFYATTNTGKFEEVKRFIDQHDPTIELKQFDGDLPEIQTMDQEEIAIDKAKQAWKVLKKPVLVDDSGVFFSRYKNFPGTLSKFVFHGIGYDGILKLTKDDPRAEIRLCMVYKDEDDGCHVFEGVTKGTIIEPETLEVHPNFTYSPIFKLEGSDKTIEQVRGTKEEGKFAYRLKALQKFLNWYREGGIIPLVRKDTA